MSRNSPSAVLTGMPRSTAHTSPQVVWAKCGSAQPRRPTASPRPTTTWSTRTPVTVGGLGTSGSGSGVPSGATSVS